MCVRAVRSCLVACSGGRLRLGLRLGGAPRSCARSSRHEAAARHLFSGCWFVRKALKEGIPGVDIACETLVCEAGDQRGYKYHRRIQLPRVRAQVRRSVPRRSVQRGAPAVRPRSPAGWSIRGPSAEPPRRFLCSTAHPHKTYVLCAVLVTHHHVPCAPATTHRLPTAFPQCQSKTGDNVSENLSDLSALSELGWARSSGSPERWIHSICELGVHQPPHHELSNSTRAVGRVLCPGSSTCTVHALWCRPEERVQGLKRKGRPEEWVLGLSSGPVDPCPGQRK